MLRSAARTRPSLPSSSRMFWWRSSFRALWSASVSGLIWHLRVARLQLHIRVYACIVRFVHRTAETAPRTRPFDNPVLESDGDTIDAATQPPPGARQRILNISDPRTDHRYLGFEDSGLSDAATSFSRCFGSVADDGGNRFRFRHACGRMAHSQVGQSEDRGWLDVGVWPRTALDCGIQDGPNPVGRSSFLRGDGWV